MLKENNKYLLLFLLLLSLLNNGCKQKLSLSPENYIAFIDDNKNGLIKKVTTSELVYEFRFRTPEYVAVREAAKPEEQKEAVKNRIHQLGNSIWIAINIKDANEKLNPLKKDVSGLDGYNQRLTYFLDEAKSHFTLRKGGREQIMMAYHFENNYGITPFDTILMSYELDNNNIEDIEIVYEDDLYQSGPIKVSISKADQKLLPTLIL